jgi:hypothetical protein
MKYMHSIRGCAAGQRNKVVEEIKKQLEQVGFGENVIIEIPSDRAFKSEFYLTLASTELMSPVREVLLSVSQDRKVKIIGGLFDRKLAVPAKTEPVIAPPAAAPIPTTKSVSQTAKKVVCLLSNHRSSIDPVIPLALTKPQLMSLLISSFSPDYQLDNLSKELNSTLKELESQGEIYTSTGNRFCMSKPTVIYEKALFCGDRAYLSLAHQALGNSSQNLEDIKLNFAELDFEKLKAIFLTVGITLIQA